MAMTGKARVAAAMRHQPVDRVPVMCQLALGHYFLNTPIPAVDIWHTSEGFGEALITLQRKYNFDGILINLPGRDPQWRSYLRRIEDKGNEKILHWKNGWTTVCPADDNPHNYRADEREYHPSFAELDPERLFYVEPHDFGGLKYPLAWGFAGESSQRDRDFPPWHFDTIDHVVRHAGHEVSVHGEVFSPFSQFLELLGCTGALLALLQDPGKSKACLQALARGSIALGCGLAAHGADAILISSAYAGGGFISTHHYREFVLPYERLVIQGIKAVHNLPIYTHTCGRIGDRLELMAKTGANGIDTLDSPPLGTVELADAKRRIGEKLFIKGNMDPVNVILQGTPGQVYEDALRCIAAGAPRGGYILSSACSIPPHAPPENIKMIAAAACTRLPDNVSS
jgi:uroporphyrinogen-III decarboxylase